MTDARAVLRIGEVSRRTGVAVPTLRAWERRYGLLAPARTEGGHRLYSDADVGRVRGMQHLLEEGWSAAAAAREAIREPASVTRLSPLRGGGDDGPAAEMVDRLERAVDAFDAAAIDGVVDDALARFEVPRALDEVILPLLRRIGDGWQQDPRVIAREHFASNTLRPRLQRLLRRATTRSSARACVAAAPEGEEHDLGLLCAAVVAADAGWRVHFLGARVPTAAIERAVATLTPDVVVIGAVFREHAESFLAHQPRFGTAAMVLGGDGFTPSDASRFHHAVVHQGAMREVEATFVHAVNARRFG